MEGICRDCLANIPFLFRGGRAQRGRCPRKTRVWAAGCESSCGGILKARSCGSKELLLIGRCPKYNKTANIPFLFRGGRAQRGRCPRKTASPLCFTSQSRVNHASFCAIYILCIYSVILTTHPTWTSLSIDLPAQRSKIVHRKW